MKKKLLSLLMVVCIFASFTVGVMAADSVQEISALINYNIKMKVDNQIWNPTEADGTAIRPITYGGRTYLPVRAVAEKLGIAIDWDNETQTVLIGEKDATPLTAEMVKSTNASFTRDADALYNGNGVFSSGVVVGSKWIGNQFSDCDFLLNGKFQTMKGYVYVQGANKTLVFEDAETKEVYKTVEAKDGQVVDFEMNVNGAQKVNLSWGGEEAQALVIGDITLR